MIFYCSGMPTMMQEIGDAIYWIIDESLFISKDVALKDDTFVLRKFYKDTI